MNCLCNVDLAGAVCNIFLCQFSCSWSNLCDDSELDIECVPLYVLITTGSQEWLLRPATVLRGLHKPLCLFRIPTFSSIYMLYFCSLPRTHPFPHCHGGYHQMRRDTQTANFTHVTVMCQQLCHRNAACHLWWRCRLLLFGKVPLVWRLLSQPFCCWVNVIFMVGFRFHGENSTTCGREFLEFGSQSSAGVNFGPCC